MDKVLIICYYWPPAGGPGVQRWLKFVKYLPDNGIQPIVFVPDNPSYPIMDDSLMAEVPNALRIIKQPIFEPYGLASLFSKKKTTRISSGVIQKYRKQSVLERLLLWVRGNLFIPDARKFWIKPSVRRLSQLISEEQIKTVITTGPPHSVHLIGLRLRLKFDIKWIADFRDPWTSIGYHKKLKLTKASQKKHKGFEQEVLNTADVIITTSKTTKQEFGQLTNKPIEVITNGYDGQWAAPTLDEKFTISHIGSLLTDRNPTVLWQVLQELCAENKDFKTSLKIQLIGVVGDGVKESLVQSALMEYVSDLGYVPHNKVLELQRKSQILLLLEIDAKETRGIIPGKLFEYFNARRPILAIGPNPWEAGNMVSHQNAGVAFSTNDANAIKSVLLNWFEAYQNGELKSQAEAIDQYSRRELTKKLAKTISWASS